VRHRALYLAFRNADQPFSRGKHLYHSRKSLGVVALSEIDEQPKAGVLLSGDTAVLFQLIVDADNPINPYGAAKPLYRDSFLFLGQDRILDEGRCSMSDEDSAGLSMGLQPRCQIHLIANDRVVHPVLTAEIADGAETPC
jgi:hypothetical protein